MNTILSNKVVENYLVDCKGYDELILDELKADYPCLWDSLEDEEREYCINYYSG